MKQKSEVEEKPFTSSLNICQKAFLQKGVEAGGEMPTHHHPNFPPDPWIFSFKGTWQ